MRFALAWLVAGALCLPGTAWAAESTVGVLVLAHGGKPQWNWLVQDATDRAGVQAPIELVFGMAMHSEEVEQIDEALERLKANGAEQVLVVPLLVSSHSEVFQQYQYVLGQREHGTWEDQVKPLSPEYAVRMVKALDEHPLIVEILLERALDISRDPGRETVVLVAHGPVADDLNQRWLAAMDRLAADLREAGGFGAVIPVTMRDDAPEGVVAAATARLRDVVETAGRDSRVLIVPVLLATGGIEDKIVQRLSGLEYRLQPEALLPHPKISQWISEQVKAGTAALLEERGR